PTALSYTAVLVPHALHSFPTRRSSDLGDMIIAVGNDSQFANLCRVIEQPDWAADERFATNAARVANRDTLVPALRQITIKRSTEDRKSTRLNSSHVSISYAVFCLKKKK